MKKLCIIENAEFYWIMHVDGEKIIFFGNQNAEYFEKLYQGIGYEIEKINW